MKLLKETKALILTIGAILCVAGSFFSFYFFNLICYYLDSFSIFGFLFFPIIAVILSILAILTTFKEKSMLYVVPVAICLIGCLLAFSFSNDVSNSKIQSDYLENENDFDIAIEYVEKFYGDDNNFVKEGIYEVKIPALQFVLLENKVLVDNIGNGKSAYLLITLDEENRYEGYAYIPHGTSLEWDDYGYFSEPLDLDGKWFYMSLLK